MDVGIAFVYALHKLICENSVRDGDDHTYRSRTNSKNGCATVKFRTFIFFRVCSLAAAFQSRALGWIKPLGVLVASGR